MSDGKKARTDEKLQFVELRAQGQSYSRIAKQLKVSKSTLSAWNKELKEQIAEQKSERLRELYESYYMLRESRIKQFGETLKLVNEALEQKDLAEMSPGQLLDTKLRLMRELKEEYVELDTETSTNLNAEGILMELQNMLTRLRDGSMDADQAHRETTILSGALKAYETATLEQKMSMLMSILGGR